MASLWCFYFFGLCRVTGVYFVIFFLFCFFFFFFFQAEDGIRDGTVTGVQTCALPIYRHSFDNVSAVIDHPDHLRSGLLFDLVDRRRNRRKSALADKHSGAGAVRSEERRVGKECRSRWRPYA